MNLSRKSFLGSIGGFLTGIPFLSGKKKIKETFSIQIEEIGEQRFRATLKTSGFFSQKIAIIDSPHFDEDHPIEPFARFARLHLLFDIQRAMKLHVFPEDKDLWNNPMSSAFCIPEYPIPIETISPENLNIAYLPSITQHLDGTSRTEFQNPNS